MENGDIIKPVERPAPEKALAKNKNAFFWILFNWKGEPAYKVIPKEAPTSNSDIHSMLKTSQILKMDPSWNESPVKDRKDAIAQIKKMIYEGKIENVVEPSTNKKKTELYTFGWRGERKYRIVYTGYSKRTPADIKDVLDKSAIYSVSTKGGKYNETLLAKDEKSKAVKKIAGLLDRHQSNPEFVAQLTSPSIKTEEAVPKAVSFPIMRPVFSHAMLSVRERNRERMFVVEWPGNQAPPAALTEGNARRFLKYAKVYEAPKEGIATISAYRLSKQGPKKWKTVSTNRMLAMIKASDTAQFVLIERAKKRLKESNV